MIHTYDAYVYAYVQRFSFLQCLSRRLPKIAMLLPECLDLLLRVFLKVQNVSDRLVSTVCERACVRKRVC